jgi:hypothetical protein
MYGWMSVHLIKLSVGSDSVSDLQSWQQQRLKEKKRKGQKPELIHITRHMPKRADEVLNGGSIYWVIKGFICARQTLIELRPVTWNGIKQCGLVYDKEVIRVSPRPYRAFQGWRYFDPKDAPLDLPKGKHLDAMPEKLQRELGALGLL